MNKREYMTELGQRLKSLPLSPVDINDAIQFYEEYFEEAGPAREQDVIAELGSPAYVAAQIALKLSTSPEPLTEKKPSMRNRMSMLWIVVLGILASPVALPLALSAAAVVFALLITAASLVFAFGVSGIACMATGGLVVIHSVIFVFATDFATSLYFIGAGLVSLGIGGFLLRFSWWIGKVIIKAGMQIGSRFFKRSKRDTVSYSPDTALPAVARNNRLQ